MRRVLAGAVLGSVLALSLTACGGDDPPESGTPSSTDGPRALTDDEADRLAVVRLNNYKRDLTPFEMEVPVGDQVLSINGNVDFRDHRAIGSLVTSDVPPSYGVFAWNLRAAGLLATQDEVAMDELATVPQKGWGQVHVLSSSDPLDTTFTILLNLALDRTENAQLLRQNGAQWLGATVVDGVDVDQMTATTEGQGQTLTYYVDATGNLVRVDIELQGAAQPATITFPPGAGAEVPVIKALGPAPS